jgi:hypothetical protein
MSVVPKLLYIDFLLGQKTSNNGGSYMRCHAGLIKTKDLNEKQLKQIHLSFTYRFYIFLR